MLSCGAKVHVTGKQTLFVLKHVISFTLTLRVICKTVGLSWLSELIWTHWAPSFSSCCWRHDKPFPLSRPRARSDVPAHSPSFSHGSSTPSRSQYCRAAVNHMMPTLTFFEWSAGLAYRPLSRAHMLAAYPVSQSKTPPRVQGKCTAHGDQAVIFVLCRSCH